jgi:hypothetical protein
MPVLAVAEFTAVDAMIVRGRRKSSMNSCLVDVAKPSGSPSQSRSGAS